jgi:hypothetical protein
MKKVVVILLICIYALATMGFALKEFYCCGKLESINFALLSETKQKCDKGEGDGCCDNKYKYYKVKDKHISSDKTTSGVNHFTELQIQHSSFLDTTTIPAEKTAMAYCSHAPPIDEGVSIYLFNCVFKI